MGKQSSKSVLVLHEGIGAGARPDELDTLVEVEQVSDALSALGWQVQRQATGLDLGSTLAAIKDCNPACVFNLVESLGGDGRMLHFIPSLLDVAQLDYTGCNSDAMYLSSQKQLAKHWMRLNGISTPVSLDMDGDPHTDEDDHRTWIVKSLWEHASFGMDDGCVVRGTDNARSRMAQSQARYGGEWFAEEFVGGREFNISILDLDGQPRVLPIAEITFVDYPRNKPKIVGYAAKWDEQAPEYNATRRGFPSLPHPERDRLEALVQKCWAVFGLEGYARVDIRLDSSGRPYVLEINANPCLSRDAGFTAAAAEGGISYLELIGHIMQSALTPAMITPRSAERQDLISRTGGR
ncbi:MAG: D-alanine--D-alanine ligase [Gammaproteobacteria bacterium]|jgi:D-alanine-D-alanine ligase|nr:D-alanine--D-alanine ligase [Gammaproteobacteria bacterium]